MLARPIRFSSRACLLAGAALCALTTAAAAKDLPVTPEGAQKLKAFFATYTRAAPAGTPSAFAVTPEGSDYLVSIDLAALAAPFKAAGVTYDPVTVKYKVVEQDDGAWRIENTDIPPISTHTPHGSSTIALTGYKGQFVIDPATAWFRSAAGGADKARLQVRADAGVDETIDIGAVKFLGTGNAGPDGATSSVVHESAAGVTVSATAQPKPDKQGDAPAAVNVNAHVDNVTLDANLDGLKSHAMLALWAFLVAHPGRADLASNEPALKGLLTAAAASALKLNETASAQKIVVQTAHGEVALDSAKIGVGADAGKPGAFEEHFAFAGLALPEGLIPAMYRDLTPTSVDIGFKASGFDVAAATAAAIADMHLAGDGPPISPTDRAAIWKTLLGPGVVTIDIPASHIVAPRLDVSVEGQVHYKDGRPTGALTVHMRNFDNTLAGLKALGPETERKMVPVLAMAKGLAKTDPDGVLTWVAELGPDGMMKVNGLPLGKAPL